MILRTACAEELDVTYVSKVKGRAFAETLSMFRLSLGAFPGRSFWLLAVLASALLFAGTAEAQVNVYTGHNDPGRDGLNSQETILTPANVNPTQFGQLFYYTVVGGILGQPLYVSNVTFPTLGTHNVVYVATGADYVYAFDADTNGGPNAQPLWQVNLANTPAGVGLTAVDGVLGTPVIDPATQTIYMVSQEAQAGVDIFRFHALNMLTGAEKFGGPIQIQASVPGTGSGSVNGTLTFNPTYQQQRPSLLFQNGVVYAAFGSIADQGAWHGWIFSFDVNPSTQTLQQVDVYCTTPNGSGGGIWGAGGGLVGEVYNSTTKPFGRMFLATANGSYSTATPASVSMSVLDFDLTNGKMTVDDQFTPYNGVLLSNEDADLGSGSPILLPTQTLASGKLLNPLVEIGKSGMFYILDRDNNADGSNNAATEYAPAGLGGFNAASDQIPQEVQTPIPAGQNWGSGVWGTEAYWNNNIYSGGLAPSTLSSLAAYSFVNGQMSTTPTSKAADLYTYSPPTPSVSANGNTNGIVWILKTDSYPAIEPEILLAYDATNLANSLYSSNTNLARDNPGNPEDHVVPTIANGKVYTGADDHLGVFGLLNSEPQTAPPTITPASTTTANFPLTLTMTAAAGAKIYYTTNGTVPNGSSAVYSTSKPPVLTTNSVVEAVASVAGQIRSVPSTATYLSPNTPPNPTFSLAPGTYTGTQKLAISDTSTAATIYYTLDGSTPAPNSGTTAVYSQPLTVSVTEIVSAIAIAPGGLDSNVSTGTYTITPVYTIDFSQGFAAAEGPMTFNGSTDVDDVRLQLTNGNMNQAGSAFFAAPVNVQAFTTQFTFQLSNPAADGITFTFQNAGPTALGGHGGSLGYGGIPKSVAIKFDLYSNAGEGPDSTGLYVNGAMPTLPSIDLSATGINLHSGDFMNATLVYNGTNLVVTITDAITLASWSQSFTIDIPGTVGGSTAYVGFTGGTGGMTSSQKILSWTYLVGPPLPNFPNGFTGSGVTLNGNAGGQAAYTGTRLRLTDGGIFESRSAFFSTELNIQQFVTSFNFQLTDANADGFTFAIQGVGPTALGNDGGGLGYSGIGTKSLAVKFDLFNNNGEGFDSTGLYTAGALPELNSSIDLTSTGFNLHAGAGVGDVMNVTMSYNGTTLVVVETDTVTKATATQTYTVNIPQIIGSPTAWVGFTGGTGGGTSIQDILNWTYNLAPSGFAGLASQMSLNGGAAVSGSSLNLTDGNSNENRSAFFTAPLNVQQFTADFSFQLTNPKADGFTFTLQGDGPTALGGAGGGLGSNGMAKSVAVKFDLYNNAGEGPDSTGLYLNGANPEMPAINLSTTGINLHSGDIFNAQMTYDGTTLTVLITDTVTNATATQSYAVNIPGIVGGSTAYVGFTGASGGLGAIQNILSWSYVAGAPQ